MLYAHIDRMLKECAAACDAADQSLRAYERYLHSRTPPAPAVLRVVEDDIRQNWREARSALDSAAWLLGRPQGEVLGDVPRPEAWAHIRHQRARVAGLERRWSKHLKM